MTIQEILSEAVAHSASDILIIAGMPAAYKIQGVIRREGERLFPPEIQRLTEELYQLAGGRDMTRLLETGDDDFSFAVRGLFRFRVDTPSSSAAPWAW